MASPTRGHLTEQVASERRRTGARSRDRFRTPSLLPWSLFPSCPSTVILSCFLVRCRPWRGGQQPVCDPLQDDLQRQGPPSHQAAVCGGLPPRGWSSAGHTVYLRKATE